MSNLTNLITPKYFEPLEGFKDVSKRLSSEGMVLLENKDNLLPLKKGSKVAIFGRIQFDYYKSGTGSGGLVNVDKVVSILDGLEESPLVEVNKDLVKTYYNWVKENPYNAGNGMWASEPWNQKEMPLNDKIILKAKEESDIAIIIIGRTAGEDRDNWYHEGSYLLSKDEEAMIEIVTKHFTKTILLLNVGNIIDMSFMDKYNLTSVIYAWHGGMEGGRATSDILVGNVTPSGKLADSIPFKIEDVSSHKNFGSATKNYYEEDIYVGYRYYETFNVPVRYPFGYGLSYTTFTIEHLNSSYENDKLNISFKVTNTGNYKGKEVVQVYLKAPSGKLGKASKSLIGFSKTKLLKPGESEIINLSIAEYLLASYDDSNKSGNKSCYVLEEGKYEIYLGNSVKDVKEVFSFKLENLKVIQKLSEAMSPKESFNILTPKMENGEVIKTYEKVATRSYNLQERIKAHGLEELPNSLKEKHPLIDVHNKKISLDEFVGQLSNEDLAVLFRGEGMSSPKVTPGCGGAIGGVCDSLLDYGIPLACVTDGPSGIRMDSGKRATSIPIGTLIACSFNLELCEEIGRLLAKEMRAYDIDTLLGPGLNIHRHPFNGRNFEYFSEDPLLSGLMAGYYTKGIQEEGLTCTLKHMCCNSQESHRFDCDSVVSERALREIYLKPFEIAIKTSDAKLIMTSYNPINGIWAASNFDLCTTIIREEWGFKGAIMSDWWAKMNDDILTESSRSFTKYMVRAQNDLYMVVGNALENVNNDDTLLGLKEGVISRYEMQRNAKNIINYLLETPAFFKKNNLEGKLKFNPKPLIETSKTESSFPLLDSILIADKEILGFKPYVTTYYIDEKIDEITDIKIKHSPKYNSKIEINSLNHTMQIILEDGEETIYNIITIDPERNYKKSEVDFSKIEHQNIYDVPKVPGVKMPLDIANPTFKSENIVLENGEYQSLPKGSYVTFTVNIQESGKYIIEFLVTTDEIGLAQIPFITYLDNENKHTLTIGNFAGANHYISEQVLINKGEYNLTFEFNMTGLHIKEINIIKHP